MSSRDDVKSGRLIYTCNCGWIDLNHMEDPATRPYVGAVNLWRQFSDNEPAAKMGRVCAVPVLYPTLLSPASLSYIEKQAKFPDGAMGYQVIYKQDMGNKYVKFGVDKTYLIRFGLTVEQKKSVALSIFMEVSKLFEAYQSGFPWGWKSDSGFSEEDLVSDLLGFYLARLQPHRKALEKHQKSGYPPEVFCYVRGTA